MEQEKVIKAIQEAVREGKLSCADAHALAARMNITLQEIGVLCNRLKIKVSACQLGCF